MKLAKIVKISISFNQLVFPSNLTDSQPLDIMENFDIEETSLCTGRLTSRLMLEIVLCKIKGITLEIFV